MEKIPVSAEWTDKERLAVIAEIVALAYSARRILFFEDMELVVLLASQPKEFLEINRQSFSKYVEQHDQENAGTDAV